MSDLSIFLVILFLAFFLLDLILSAAASSLENISRARLLSMRQEAGDRVDILISLLDSPSRSAVSHSGLRFLKKLVFFLITVDVVVFLFHQFFPDFLLASEVLKKASNVLCVLGALLIIGLLLTWTEAVVIERTVRHAEKWALSLSRFLRIQELVLSPLMILPFLIDRHSAPAPEPGAIVTEDEIKSMVDASEQGGILEQEERKMIYSIFDLRETIAREVMVPRIDIFALDVNEDIRQNVDTLLESGYSRVPVYEDTIDNIIGLLYTKDLFKAWRTGTESIPLADHLRPAYFIPESKNLDDLLAEMQTRRIHLAIAVDEYGGVAGLVTMEDIVEEIVGDIRDEFDDGEEIMYRQVSEDVFFCSGRMNLDDLNETLGTALPVDGADTLAGLIYNRIGHVPVAGESIRIDDVRLTIEQVHKRRISLVRAERLSPPQILAEISAETAAPATDRESLSKVNDPQPSISIE